MYKNLVFAALALGLVAAPVAADPGTAISFQGELRDAGAPAMGSYDFEVALYGVASSGVPIDTRDFADVAVEAGLFELEPDFTDISFAASAPYWLEVRVRAGTSTGAYTPLLPRQAVMPSPYALNARSVQANAIDAAAIAPGAVGADEVADNSLGSAEIATDGVGSDEIATNAVTAAEITLDAVGAPELAANAVGAPEIASGAVGADEIASGGVGSDEIASSAVGSDEIAFEAITAQDIGANAVGLAEIDVSQVQRKVNACGPGLAMQAIGTDGTPTCVATGGAGTITGVTAGTALSGGGTSGGVTLSVASGGIGTTQLADGGVGTVDLGPNVVTAAKIDAATVQARVTGTCASGAIRSIAANGTVTCNVSLSEPRPDDDLSVLTGASGDSSIVIGRDGLPVIAVHDAAGGRLLAIHCENLACSSQTVTPVDTGNVGAYASVTLINGLPAIAYYDAGNTALKLALCNDPACSTATLRVIDNTGSVGEFASIGVNAFGAMIAYYDRGAGDLKVATCNNAACASPTLVVLDSTGDVGQNIAAFSMHGAFVIGYQDVGAQQFKVVTCASVPCSGVPYVADATVGSGGSIASVATAGNRVRFFWRRNSTTQTAACTTRFCSGLSAASEVAPRFYRHMAATRDALGHAVLIGDWVTSAENIEFMRCDDLTCATATQTHLFNLGAAGVLDAQVSIALGAHGYPVYVHRRNADGGVNVCNSDGCQPWTMSR